MKRLPAFLVISTLLLTMTACRISTETATPAPTTEPTVPPTTASTAPPAPVINPAPALELTVGQTGDTTYINPYFNLNFTLPAGWRFATDEELCERNGITGGLANLDLKSYLGSGGESLVVMKASQGSEIVTASLTKVPVSIRGMGIANYMPILQDNLRVTYEGYDNGVYLLGSALVDEILWGEPTTVLQYGIYYSEYDLTAYCAEAILQAGDYMLTVRSYSLTEAETINLLRRFTRATI